MQQPRAQPADLKWLYEKNLEIAKIFFDWRHKLLSLGLGAASALVALSAALHSGRAHHGHFLAIAAATPALVGMAIAIAVAAVNVRHAPLGDDAYAHWRARHTSKLID